jgi:hypothetical protein
MEEEQTVLRDERRFVEKRKGQAQECRNPLTDKIVVFSLFLG